MLAALKEAKICMFSAQIHEQVEGDDLDDKLKRIREIHRASARLVMPRSAGTRWKGARCTGRRGWSDPRTRGSLCAVRIWQATLQAVPSPRLPVTAPVGSIWMKQY